MITITSGSDWKDDLKDEYYGILAFNEAMERGTPKEIIFSDEFIADRVKVLNTNERGYRKKLVGELKEVIDNLKTNKDFDLRLIFDACYFCQINIVTLLGYLDYNGYSKDIELNYWRINKDFIETIIISPTGFYKIYKKVLINKEKVIVKGNEILSVGISKYIDEKRWIVKNKD